MFSRQCAQRFMRLAQLNYSFLTSSRVSRISSLQLGAHAIGTGSIPKSNWPTRGRAHKDPDPGTRICNFRHGNTWKLGDSLDKQFDIRREPCHLIFECEDLKPEAVSSLGLIGCDDPVRNRCRFTSENCDLEDMTTYLRMQFLYWRFEWNLNLIVARRKDCRWSLVRCVLAGERVAGTLYIYICIYIFATTDYQLSILSTMWLATSDNLVMSCLLPFRGGISELTSSLTFSQNITDFWKPKHQPRSWDFHATSPIFAGAQTRKVKNFDLPRTSSNMSLRFSMS